MKYILQLMNMSQLIEQDTRLQIMKPSMSRICTVWEWKALTSKGILGDSEHSLHNDFWWKEFSTVLNVKL